MCVTSLHADVNECQRELHECDVNANCVDNIGSYDCRCNIGYLGDGFSCYDINECNVTNPTHNCHVFANCNNTEGSFVCTCHLGYTGDGISCSKYVYFNPLPILLQTA